MSCNVQRIDDTPATRAKGWRHVALFGLFFMPSSIDVVEVMQRSL